MEISSEDMTYIPTSNQTTPGKTHSQSNISIRDNDNAYDTSDHKNTHLKNAKTGAVSFTTKYKIN